MIDLGKNSVKQPAKVFPKTSAGVVVTSGVLWTLGSATLIMPANTESSGFLIHSVVFELLVPTGFTYEMVLYDDAGCTNEIIRIRTPIVGQVAHCMALMLTPSKPVYAKLAAGVAGAKATISLLYYNTR